MSNGLKSQLYPPTNSSTTWAHPPLYEHPHLDEGHVLLGDGAVARVKVRLVEKKVVDVEAPRETYLVILQK